MLGVSRSKHKFIAQGRGRFMGRKQTFVTPLVPAAAKVLT